LDPMAVDPTASDASLVDAGAGGLVESSGLRRALGEERLREYASPFLKPSELRATRGQGSLASDLDLR
jgi:hypothetical protein